MCYFANGKDKNRILHTTVYLFGTAGGGRTRMMFPSSDFKSGAYTVISPQPHCLGGCLQDEPHLFNDVFATTSASIIWWLSGRRTYKAFTPPFSLRHPTAIGAPPRSRTGNITTFLVWPLYQGFAQRGIICLC